MPTCMESLASAPGTRTDDAPEVLIIDDDPAMLELLSMVLEDNGFRVVTARNGVCGLQAFREHALSAVLTDIIMPELDGIATILEMRRERADVKVIAISGRTQGWNCLTVARKLGADATFEKGRHPAILIQTLKKLLRRPSGNEDAAETEVRQVS